MGEGIAQAVFLALAVVLFGKFVLLYNGSFLNSVLRFVVCWAVIVVLYNAILKLSFPDSEFAVNDVSRYGSGDYSISLEGNEKYYSIYADNLVIEIRTDKRNKTTVKAVRRTAIDVPSYAKAVLLVPNAEISKKYKQWLLEALDDPFVGLSYQTWEEQRDLDKNKSAQ